MAKDSDYNDHFGPENIPFGIASFSTDSLHLPAQAATRVFGHVIFLSALAEAGHFKDIEYPLHTIFKESTLNTFAALPRGTHRLVRKSIIRILNDSGNDLEERLQRLPAHSVFPVSAIQMHLPIFIGDFTDFSVSVPHNLRASEAVLGRSFLPPAFHHFPMGYGGRSSSVVISGTPVDRPLGQFIDRDSGDEKTVIFAPSRAVDYELEVAAVVGKPVAMNERLSAASADEHIFGLVLLNDWSARDIQGFEMMPLGPLNGKNFGTSISPWIVTLDALEAFRVEGPKREQAVAPYLSCPDTGSYSVDLTVEIIANGTSTTTCRSNLGKAMHWNFRQMLAHQTIGGCSLATGDFLASGTVSEESEDARGCLMESTWGAKKPLVLQDGTSRTYLKDGDVVRFTGVAGQGVGFGECIGVVKPARAWE